MADELQVIVQESGLAENKVKELMSHFGTSFAEAHKLAESSKNITVTSEDQVEEMSRAREARLALKNLRIKVENTRKELKETALREGKAIDGAANIIKALIVPVEEHLEKQEKFAEELANKRKAEKLEGRKTELSKYVSDISVYDLENLSNETFTKLLEDAKKAYWAQKDAELKAEEERLAEEKKRQEEQEKIRKENEELRKKQEEQDKAIAEERRLAAIEKEKQEAALKKEREEKEKLEAKIRQENIEKQRAAAAEEARIEKEKEAEAEAKRQADLAPDKDKMRAFYAKLSVLTDELTLIEFANEDSRNVANEAYSELKKVQEHIVFNMKKL